MGLGRETFTSRIIIRAMLSLGIGLMRTDVKAEVGHSDTIVQ